MTGSLRRVGVGLLVLMLAALVTLSAGATAYAQEDCYPVPPGGCEPEPEVEDEVLCADIIAAIVAGDTSQDQNGDGQINQDDLPASCTCEDAEALIAAVAAGDLDPSALGALSGCCSELIAAISSGAIDADALPADALASCTCEDAEALIAAVAAGELDASVLGALSGCCSELIEAVNSGAIDADALPADAFEGCSCDDLGALVAAVAAGELDASLLDQLGACCAELVDAVVNGDIDPETLPDDIFAECDCEQLERLVEAGVVDASVLEDCQAPLPAATGADATGMAAMTLAALAGGAGLLVLSRRTA